MYEAAGGGVGGTLLQFALFLSMGYCGGCLYPVHFLPKTMQSISAFLPSGASRVYMAGLILKDKNFGSLALLMLFTVLSILGACLLRRSRLYESEAERL
jgi:ABC-type uncharacterized transport system permease subunit